MKSTIAILLGLSISIASHTASAYEPIVDEKMREVREFFKQDTQRFNRAVLVAGECRRAMESTYSTERFEKVNQAKNHMDELVNRVPFYGPADKNFAELSVKFYTPGPGSVELMEQHLNTKGGELVLQMSAKLIQDVRDHKVSFGQAIRTYENAFYVCGRDGDHDTMRIIALEQLVQYFKDNWTAPGQNVYDVMVNKSL